MKDWFYKLQMNIQSWMYGRNGPDDVARAAYMSGFILTMVNFIFRSTWLSALTMAMFAYSIYRICSKDIRKRREENDEVVWWFQKRKKYVELIKLQWKHRKTHRYYICKSCRQIVRMPKGKGRIEIVCPTCKHKFIKRT